MDSQNQIAVLTRLGLTVNQAKLFIALVQMEPSTVTQIAKTAGLAREVVYRTMPSLQRMGLIAKTITFPLKFYAIPVETAIRILLERKVKETHEVRTKAIELVKQMKPKLDLETKTERQLVSIIGKERLIIFSKRQMLTSKSSVDTMVPYTRIYTWLPTFSPILKKLLAKKVKIRLIVASSQEKIEHSDLDLFKDSPYFKVKFIPDRLQTIVGVIDNKDTLINTSVGKPSVYWSNDTGIISLSNTYFEKCWASPEVP